MQQVFTGIKYKDPISGQFVPIAGLSGLQGDTPLLRKGQTGIEVSYDEGTTWTVLILFSDLVGYADFTAVLTAGSSTITIQDQLIDSTKMFDFYTDVYGISPINVNITNGSIVLTFDEQQTDLTIKARMWL